MHEDCESEIKYTDHYNKKKKEPQLTIVTDARGLWIQNEIHRPS